MRGSIFFLIVLSIHLFAILLNMRKKLATSLQDCEALLIDLGGTLTHGDTVIDGAVDFLFTLKKKRIPFYIVANNTTESSNEVLLKLKTAGCAVAHDQLITASQVGIAYAQREGITSIAVIGSDEQKKNGKRRASL